MAQREKPIELITPPNMLKVKVGGAIPATDPSAIERAERALEVIKHEFSDWLGEEVSKLEAQLREVRTNGLKGESGEALFTTAHDLRGLGTTYEFPIISRMAGSLSKLIDTEEKRAEIPMSLVEAHVGAIRAAILQNVRTEADPIGKALADELETRVVALVGESE